MIYKSQEREKIVSSFLKNKKAGNKDSIVITRGKGGWEKVGDGKG